MIKKLLFTIIFISQFFWGISQINTEGYYKDVFMDGGVYLYSKTSMTAVDSLHLTMEYLATENQSIQDTKIVGDSNDLNGALLYPDGEPRFRLIYTNGGSATSHGTSLGGGGRDIIRAFYHNGGSYTGSCAGAFLTSMHYQSTGINNSYYHIWPGRTHTTGVLNTYTGQFIPLLSPLLQYYSFGGDHYVANVFHDGGCYAREDIDFPSQTEILLRFDYPGYTMHNKASSWAYKKNNESGRLVVIGSHPENADSGERLNIMKAIMQYALAGQGKPHVKASLDNGIALTMNKSTNDNDPAHTKIGDRQYHHFKVSFPNSVSNFAIKVDAQTGYHLNIYIKKDTFAFKSNALYADTGYASSKIFNVGNLAAGTYYISVECDTTVTTTLQNWGYDYTGNLAVLNGISYSIRLDWLLSIQNNILNNIIKIYPNPSTDIIHIEIPDMGNNSVNILVVNTLGKIMFSHNAISTGSYNYLLNVSDLPKGIYFISLNIGNNKYLKKIIVQ
jgi:hypothetical protein